MRRNPLMSNAHVCLLVCALAQVAAREHQWTLVTSESTTVTLCLHSVAVPSSWNHARRETCTSRSIMTDPVSMGTGVRQTNFGMYEVPFKFFYLLFTKFY